MSKKSVSSKEIKHPMVRGYLLKNFPGSLIYVNKNGNSEGKYGVKETAHCLRKAGFPDEAIAKRLHMFRSQLAKVNGFTLK